MKNGLKIIIVTFLVMASFKLSGAGHVDGPDETGLLSGVGNNNLRGLISIEEALSGSDHRNLGDCGNICVDNKDCSGHCDKCGWDLECHSCSDPPCDDEDGDRRNLGDCGNICVDNKDCSGHCDKCGWDLECHSCSDPPCDDEDGDRRNLGDCGNICLDDTDCHDHCHKCAWDGTCHSCSDPPCDDE